MWMVDPFIMCRQHLPGEHNEVHMFGGSIKRRIHTDGYLKANCFEANSIGARHEELVEEMVGRGYEHNSILVVDMGALNDIPRHVRDFKIDSEGSLSLLLQRCTRCRKRYKEKHRCTLF
ncbi:hypothetical protein CUJ83_08790 [Methanocella sp. CWC-04]|uniref:Uncharacterized protein n=2 Tax=Methanooceanicella nereidis TaxID=2052831 RepID=A0AAP2W684_9EURY|nr:hypothetical protein [Methanocella sp. CWC-04]